MTDKHKKQNREKRYTIRLTPDEEDKMLADMRSFDYLSAAKYIRDCVLNKRVTVRKYKMTDKAIRNQINLLTEQVKRIGKNYNQIVVRFESLTKTKRTDGTPVISPKNTVFFMDRLAKLTVDLKEQMNKVIETVDKLQLADSESPNINT